MLWNNFELILFHM